MELRSSRQCARKFDPREFATLRRLRKSRRRTHAPRGGTDMFLRAPVLPLISAGCGVKLWPFAVKHWCFAENMHIYDGDCAYRKRFGCWTKALPIPFGALFDFLPPKSLLKKLPKFDGPSIPGIMVGYRTHPGGKWTGDYKIIPMMDFDAMKTTGRTVRCY